LDRSFQANCCLLFAPYEEMEERKEEAKEPEGKRGKERMKMRKRQ
jgi:hypothetical protein